MPESVAAAAARLGWQDSDVDWRRVDRADDIDLVDICTPGDTHAEIALAALAAGKHVLCEKPLANSVAEAEAMVAAAAAAPGQQAMVGFTYRRTPAVALAREMVADGTIGTVRQVRAQYLQDWLSDENAPLTWRMDKEKAGSGALGDIGAHIIDAIEFVTGQRLTGVSGRLETFVKQRPVAAEGGGGTGIGWRRRQRIRPGHRRRRGGVLRHPGIRCAGRRSRRPGSRWAGRMPCGSRSTAARAVSRSISRA